MTKTKSVFDTLSAIDLKSEVKEKQGQKYLPWATAWAKVKELYPDASYEVLKDSETGLPFKFHPNMGYMVETSVTIDGQTHSMWLPVMDHNNEAMFAVERKIKRWKGFGPNRKQVDVPVAPANMFDINTTIMRCLVKNIAMFGLGIYIYKGHDEPLSSTDPIEPEKKTPNAAPPVGGTSAPEPEKPKKKETLNEDHGSWQNALAYAAANKDKGIEWITDNLRKRFAISAKTKSLIKKHIE